MTAAEKAAGGIVDLGHLLAHALAIEVEAADRYRMLADQMEVHNNVELAAMFGKLAEIEGKHAIEIAERARDIALPHPLPWEYAWPGRESPEAIDPSQLHVSMTPHEALLLALKAEEGAQSFYEWVAEQSDDEDVRALATDFAADEIEHVAMVKEMLKRYPPPATDPPEDPDPPIPQG